MAAKAKRTMQGMIAAIAVTLCAATGTADASIVFSFSWTGDPTEDATIVSSPDATLRASGTIEIDASPGSSFNLLDIIATSITVTGNSITPFVFTSWDDAAGSIAADGMSATFVGAGSNEPFFFSTPAFFGCFWNSCDPAVIRVRSGTANNVEYGSVDDALASMRMTAVPEPGTLALLGLGLAGLAATRRRKQ